MVQSRQKRSKQRGYEVEKAFEARLQLLFPTLKRQGSVHYYKDAPDLQNVTGNVVVQCKGNKTSYVDSLWRGLRDAAPEAQLHIVATQTPRGKYLVTFEVDELQQWVDAVAHHAFDEGVTHSG